MELTDSERFEVLESLRTHHGDHIAALIMSAIPNFDWGTVATKDDLARLEGGFKHEIAQLEVKLTRNMYTALLTSHGALAAILALVITLVAVLI